MELVEKKVFLSTADIMELLAVSRSMAYKILQRLNKELQGKGYFTQRGRVPTEYFCKRYNVKV